MESSPLNTHQHSNILASASNADGSKHSKIIIAMAVGVILALAGFFLALASFRALPSQENFISLLGLKGKLMSGGILSLGLVGIGYGAISQYQQKKPVILAKISQSQGKKVTLHAPVSITRPSQGGREITEKHFEDFLSYRTKGQQEYARAHNVTFFHYLCDAVQDKGWGCAWRVIQMIASSLGLWPGLRELSDKYRTDKSKPEEWAEPGVGKSYLDDVGFASELVLYKRNQGTQLTKTEKCTIMQESTFSNLRAKLLTHFQTQATPIMADDVVYTYAIIGIRIISEKETILFIGDPHKLSSTQGLYYVVLDAEGRQVATTGDDTTGYRSAQRLDFSKPWMFLFPSTEKIRLVA